MKSKIRRTLEASILCLRFPFLYPRNRFTGRHVVAALGKVWYKLYTKSINEIGITATLYKEKVNLTKWEKIYDTNIKLDIENRKLLVANDIESKEVSLKSLLWSDDRFKILGMRVSFALSGRPNVIIYVTPVDENDKTNYGFHYEEVKLLTNKFKFRLYKIIQWFDREVLDRILFLPSYTELDAMPEGWRKVFGIQMCKEIKAALKKHKGALHKYRITQIKEKFGSLRWYDNWSTEEVSQIIRKYESISARTCIDCGKPATKISTGWICPYCDDCIGDRNYEEIKDDESSSD